MNKIPSTYIIFVHCSIRLTEIFILYFRQEWEYCRDQLFGSDLLMKQRAVEHLYVWKAR